MCENLVLLFNVLGLVRTPRNGAILDSNPRSDHKIRSSFYRWLPEFQFSAM